MGVAGSCSPHSCSSVPPRDPWLCPGVPSAAGGHPTALSCPSGKLLQGWIQVGSGQFSPGSSQEEKPKHRGWAQRGRSPARPGRGGWQSPSSPGPSPPQPRPERCRSLSRARAAHHGHRSHRRGSQCHAHHPATHARKGSCPQPCAGSPACSCARGIAGAAVGSRTCCWRPGRAWGAASEENNDGVWGERSDGSTMSRTGIQPGYLRGRSQVLKACFDCEESAV